MRTIRSLTLLAAAAFGGCAHAHAHPPAPEFIAGAKCPLPNDARGYAVSASAAGVPNGTLTAIANAVAEAWPGAAADSLHPRVISAPLAGDTVASHWRKGWAFAPSDTATVSLIYYRGQPLPQVGVLSKPTGFAALARAAAEGAVDAASANVVSRDTLPLALPDHNADSTVVIVRFGATPDGSDGVAHFSLQELAPMPAFSKNAVPQYPGKLRDRQVEGSVIIDAVVSADGQIVSARTVRSSDPLFTQSAAEFLSKAAVLAATRDCVRVPARVEWPFVYTLGH